jgi:nucleoside-specific outer membrane channel protein Tsx
MRKLSLAALGIVALAALPVSAADWSDTNIGYRYGTNFQEPANPDSMAKNIINFTHASGYSLGSNFFSIDLLNSSSTDKSNNSASGAAWPVQGAHEVYVAYKTNLSVEKAFGQKVNFGPVRGIDLTAGFDWSAKNTTFAPAVYKLMAGPTLNFKVPGFFNLSFLYYRERNHNAFGGFNAQAGGTPDVVFKSTYQIAGAWGIPVKLGAVNSSVKGFFTYTGEKGIDGSAVDTKPESLLRAYWMFDVSPLLGTKKGTWQIGPGFEFWDNKFGDPTYATVAEATAHAVVKNGKTVTPGVNPQTKCVMAALEIHF